MGQGDTSVSYAEQLGILEGALQAAIRIHTRASITRDPDSLLAAYGRVEYVYGAVVIVLGLATGEEHERAMYLANQASTLKNDWQREVQEKLRGRR